MIVVGAAAGCGDGNKITDTGVTGVTTTNTTNTTNTSNTSNTSNSSTDGTDTTDGTGSGTDSTGTTDGTGTPTTGAPTTAGPTSDATTDATSATSEATSTTTSATTSTTGPGATCGWDPMNGYYECGFEGEDPGGTPIACPQGLVEGAPCADTGLTGVGCCDADGNNWYCAEGEIVFLNACA